MGRRISGWSAVFLLLVTSGASAQDPSGVGRSGPTGDGRTYEAPARRATWTPDPGPWRVIERRTLHVAQGHDWLIESGRRRLGNLTGGRTVVEVDLPRIVIGIVAVGETTLVRILLPDGNRDVVLRPAGGDDGSGVPSESTEDAYGRWPNPCSFTLLDATGDLDLDADGTAEIAIRRLCSCAPVPCSGIVFIELDPTGPELLDLPSIIGNVDVGSITVREIESGKDPARPILEIAPDLLDGCRFIALAGVRGASECADCCLFPVLARPATEGYEVFYDPDQQKELLMQAQKDVGYVAAGDPGPLRSLEEAQVARAASFYYLTGLGPKTRSLLSEALGARAREDRVRQLLGILDDVFLGRPSRQR